jgi:hypothetical protein
METSREFAGWAIVELYGHAKEAGYVTTQYFGTAALFQIDVPELPERTETLVRPQWIGNKLAPIGTEVKREALPGRTRYVGTNSIYSLNPCTEELVRATLERLAPRDIAIVRLPENMQLEIASTQDEDTEYSDEEETEAVG